MTMFRDFTPRGEAGVNTDGAETGPEGPGTEQTREIRQANPAAWAGEGAGWGGRRQQTTVKSPSRKEQAGGRRWPAAGCS